MPIQQDGNILDSLKSFFEKVAGTQISASRKLGMDEPNDIDTEMEGAVVPKL